ncbi:hypothetical protein [Holospora curviuscula]|uniref:Uncharacterized protein n=1 Tax=Holospora curviuscula TaxID=1082868 RepID=A0A2S5RHY7_9PROT|nr:hypothetical protein [Holospora curviuscula]PPE06887.1 hypothetical protein HCUR_00101 [Holospora curviuscula]
MDTQGIVHGTVYDANHRREGAMLLCNTIPTVKSVFVDAGYGKTMLAFVRNGLNKTIEISEPQDRLCSPKDRSLNEPLLGSIIIQDCLKRTKSCSSCRK